MSDPFPAVPDEPLDGWRLLERTVDTPFDAGVVSVEAHTLVYEDEALRQRLDDAAGIDRLWRFFTASRLRLYPTTPPSDALTRLVTSRAHSGFADRLRERGFENVRRAERRHLRLNGRTARLSGYDAVCRLSELSLRVRGKAAVWAVNDGYLLAGGAYPTGVRDAADRRVADAVGDILDPDAYDADLTELIRATGTRR